MRLERFAALLALVLPLAPWSGAEAQTDKAGVDAATGAQQPAPPADIVREDDIVVTARRYGEAKVAAETEFSEAEIAAQGTDSIQQLVSRLTPFIGGEEPILLINGRPADGDQSILFYPAEALNRVAVLKPEAAAQYGYAAGKRVMNLVLKETFASLNVDAGASWATAGDQYGGSLSAGRVAIDGQVRWNAQARIQHDSALFRSDRNIPPDDLAVPDGTAAIDPGDFETLLPSRTGMSFNAGITRPLGTFSASLNVNAGSNGSTGLRGFAPGAVAIPGEALQSDNSSQSLGAGFNLTGRIAGWQTSFAANYGRSWTDSLLERGGIDPSGDRPLLADRNRSRGENVSARINVSKTIVDLPAGPLTSSISIDASRNRSENRSSDIFDRLITLDKQSGGQMNGQVSFNVPLSQQGNGEIPPLGNLSVDLTLGGQKTSDSGLQKRFGGSVNWSPFTLLQLRGSFEHAETAPSFDQLEGPPFTTINRIFDFARQETVDVVWVIGGNPDLQRGTRQSLSLTARVVPFDDQMLSLDVAYRRETAKGGLAGFPDLTPVIEAAFPERVTRDAAGRLIAIDARAINITRDTSDELNSGIALRLPRQRAASLQKPDANPWQFSISLNHNWRLTSALLTRPGVPLIDRLGGDGGQSRHLLSLQMTAGKRGIGANVNGNWSSATRVRNSASADGAADFISKPPAIFNLSFFVEPEHIVAETEMSPWMKDIKLSLEVQNLLNGYRRLTLADGSVPAGYSRDEIDPLGRTMRVTVRKTF